MKRPSLRAAVDAKCKSCIYDPGFGGTWREQVAGCASSNCPLHPVRPMPTAIRGQKPALQEADPTEEPEPSVSALLGAAFTRDGTTGPL